MGVVWTLVVEARESRDNVAVVMTLLDEERRWQWRARREIDHNQFDHLRQLIQRCFAFEYQQSSRGDQMLQLALTMNADLNLQEFLDASRLDEKSCLVINTTVTSIPWDLVLFRGRYLASELAVVLNIPIANETYFKQGYVGRSLPRLQKRHDTKPVFLHILANPYNDLKKTEQEKEELKKIVESTSGLDYRFMENLTVSEILDEFGKPGLRFLHYSGHILPGKGLLVGTRRKPEILKIVNIESRFPGTGHEIVFLNGCDSHLDSPNNRDDGDNRDLDIFMTASVANAFLHGWAGVVIAPRSKISDEDAFDAAVYIWRRFFCNLVPLATTVRDYRRESIANNPNTLGGYTYVLYGTSSISTSLQWSSDQSNQSMEPFHEHPLIRQAAIDAGGTIQPRHLFAALTRSWELGRVFFSYFDQGYIVYLTQLREYLGCNQIIPRATSIPTIKFSSATDLVIEAIVRAAGSAIAPTTMDFIKVIDKIGDAEIVGAVRQLGIAGLELKDICETALLLNEKETPRALFDPDGWAATGTLLRGLYDPHQNRESVAGQEGAIDLWDVFSAIAGADAYVGSFLGHSGLAKPPLGTWNVSVPLHWCFLTASARNAFMVAAREMKDECAECVSESHLVYALFNNEAFDWNYLPDDARVWLKDRAHWEAFRGNILLQRLGWLNA